MVAALGGNALLQRGDPLTADNQRRNVLSAAGTLAEFLRVGHQLAIIHGNGPQVGFLALQNPPEDGCPLDALGAETAGMLGYLIEQELENAFDHDRPVATLLTQVVVDRDDPAFSAPTKFVGAVCDQQKALVIADANGGQVSQDGDKWRCVVASPAPHEIPDTRVIKLVLDVGAVVICTGGGGIPVIRQGDGSLTGIEAVVDKDASTALLAQSLGADVLLLLTDADAVYRDFGTEKATKLSWLSSQDALNFDAPAGSMAPKLAAAAAFAAADGTAEIVRLQDAVEI
ncbi:MAG: carbamate kinase, partial [Roseovarius sp.]|nr:carbamate kinase [Roseovarius sp.]